MPAITDRSRARARRTAAIEALGLDLVPAMIEGTIQICTQAIPGDRPSSTVVTRDLAYGAHARHVLDVYTSGEGDALRPVLLFVHGGGFVTGSKGTDESPFVANIGEWAARRGLIGVNMNYRLAPEATWPDGADDISQALAWIHANIAAYGGDPRAVFLMGQSAGAMLVADYLGRARRLPPPLGLAGAVLISCLYDVGSASDLPMHRAYWGEDRAQWVEKGSMGTLIQTDTPLFLAVAEFDAPEFHRHAALLVDEWLVARGVFPPLRYLAGENHLSTVYRLGSDDDRLGPLLEGFMADVLAD